MANNVMWDWVGLEMQIQRYARSPDGKREIGAEIANSIAMKQQMELAAKELIRTLQECAQNAGLPEDVLRHFRSLGFDPPQPIGDGSQFEIGISFRNHDDLKRQSLLITSGEHSGERTGRGIDNIVALFDSGYSAKNQVFGEWEGRGEVGSRQSREAKHFIAQAIDIFNRKYGARYSVTASVAPGSDFYGS